MGDESEITRLNRLLYWWRAGFLGFWVVMALAFIALNIWLAN